VLQVAFDLLEDMRASGLTPSTPTCSSLIYACLQNNNFAAARKVSYITTAAFLGASVSHDSYMQGVMYLFHERCMEAQD
jgi:hypothetical protein